MVLTISDDFSLYKIAESGQCFRIRRFEDGVYRFVSGRHILYIRELSPGRFEALCDPGEWNSVWSAYFDLERDYAKIRAAIPKRDTYMYMAAQAGKGIRILRQSPWEALIAFIVSQRKSIPAIENAVDLLAQRFGEPVITHRETVFLFPDPDRLASADLDALISCKLGYRAPYVLDASLKVRSGTMDLRAMDDLSDEQLIEQLKLVRGVGTKVANCVALFSYGRTALAPVDTWIGKVILKQYGGIDPFPAYGETAGILQQYVFYHALKHKSDYGAKRK